MPTIINRTWYLEVNGIPLATPAWETWDLDPLLTQPNVRGENTEIPGIDGLIVNPIRPTQTTLTFPIDVDGRYEPDGTLNADPATSMVSHRDYLADHLGFGEDSVVAIFHRGPTLPALSGDVQFLGLKGWSTLDLLTGSGRTTFDLRVIAGELVEVGS